MSNDHLCGPGPIILTADTHNVGIRYRNKPGLHIVTRDEIATMPIHPQWLTGTPLGLLTTWPNEQTARDYANQRGTQLARIQPITVDDLYALIVDHGMDNDDTLVILTHPNGTPLTGQP